MVGVRDLDVPVLVQRKVTESSASGGAGMLRFKRVGEHYEFSIGARPPLIYLDHWAVRKLSKQGEVRDRFIAAFKHRGTLMFSLMNVVEIARDVSPERTAEIRSLLEEVGANWAPMTIDPMRILAAEEVSNPEGGVHPCVSAAFLGDPEFCQGLVEGGVSLVHCVDLTRAGAGRAVKSLSGGQEAEMLRNLQEWRDAYRRDPSELDRKFPDVAFDSQRPMRTIYNGIARLTIRDTFRLDAEPRSRPVPRSCRGALC